MNAYEQAIQIRRDFDDLIQFAEAILAQQMLDLLDSGTINFRDLRRALAMGDRRMHDIAKRHLGHPLPTLRTHPTRGPDRVEQQHSQPPAPSHHAYAERERRAGVTIGR